MHRLLGGRVSSGRLCTGAAASSQTDPGAAAHSVVDGLPGEALHAWVGGDGVWKIGRGLGAGPAVQPRHLTVIQLSDIRAPWKQLADGRELNSAT